jgi:transposase InsO family protein
VWAMDFQFDATADGRRLKFLNVIDEHSRLCLAIRVDRRCKAKDVVAVLEELTSLYPAATTVLSSTASQKPCGYAHALRKWCQSSGTSTAYIEPGAPWQNGFAESYELRSTSSTTAGSGMNSSTPSCLPRWRKPRAWPIAGQGMTKYPQAPFGPPGAYAPGGSSTRSCSMITTTPLISTGPMKGVTSALLISS